MPIISVEIMRRIDEKKKQKKTNKDRKEKGNRSYSERVRAKRFCCAFKVFCS